MDQARKSLAELRAAMMDRFRQLRETLIRNQDGMLDQLAKSDDANRLIRLVGETQIRAKEFLLRDTAANAEAVRGKIAEAEALADDLKARFTEDADKARFDSMRANAADYLARFEDVVKILGDQHKANERMVAAADSVNEQVTAVQATEARVMGETLDSTRMLIALGAAARFCSVPCSRFSSGAASAARSAR